MLIAMVVLLGIIVAQLVFLIFVLQVEAGNIRDFLHEIHGTLLAIRKVLHAAQVEAEINRESKGQPGNQ